MRFDGTKAKVGDRVVLCRYCFADHKQRRIIAYIKSKSPTGRIKLSPVPLNSNAEHPIEFVCASYYDKYGKGHGTNATTSWLEYMPQDFSVSFTLRHHRNWYKLSDNELLDILHILESKDEQN